MTAPTARPGAIGLWAGFLDRMPASEAVDVARRLEELGVDTIWLQEFSGADPFIRAALYLDNTTDLSVALGVATIHARDASAMASAATTLEDAFPGRFHLGLGVSHAPLAAARGATYSSPLSTMRDYLGAMDEAAGTRPMPMRFLGALGPKMVELGGAATAGVHTYFCPVAHTAAAREAIGPDGWIAPTQMVALDGEDPDWRDRVRPYFGLCLGMDNYRRNLNRFGFDDAALDAVGDDLVDALVVSDQPEELAARIAEQQAAGADHVVLQLVPPPRTEVVVDRIAAGLEGISQVSDTLTPYS